MKHFFTLIALLLPVSYSHAQSSYIVDEDYNRNSLSVIMMNYGDNYENYCISAVSRLDLYNKYDKNEIRVTTMRSAFVRNGSTTSTQRRDFVNREITRQELGKQIISYWFDRKIDGTMSIDRLLERGRYDATDTDYLKAMASHVGEASLGDRGFELLNNTYVLIVDVPTVEEKKFQNITYYEASATGYLFKLNFSEQLMNDFFDTWIYPEDTIEEKERKKKNFDYLQFPVEYVGSSTGGSSMMAQSYELAINSSVRNMLKNLENSNEKLLVKTPVTNVSPIQAKIGRKEGVKNKSRYFVYSYYEDESGHIGSKRVGVVRATKVADNRGIASGDSGKSKFYQIAGGKIEEGFLLSQRNDSGSSLGIGYRSGALEGVVITYDWLMAMTSFGMSHYLTIDAGIWGYKGMMAISPTVGYAFSFRFLSYFELGAGVGINLDYLWDGSSSENIGSRNSSSDIAFNFVPSGFLNVNIAYPVQLFVGVNYAYNLSDFVYDYNFDRSNKVGIYGGLRFCF